MMYLTAKPFVLLIIIFFCFFEGSAQSKKAVIILLDGIPADVLENVSTPTLDEIAEQGGYTRAFVGGKKGHYSETPTISAPGYMNMITGVWGNKHNVWGNRVKDPNYHYWNIFRITKHADPDREIAIFSTWLDNRTKLIGEGKPEAGNIMFDHSVDGFELDTATYPHLPDRKFIFDIDEHVSAEAGKYIRSGAPDLSWVYLEFTDDMGHKFGDSPQMNDAVQKADRQVQRIWEAVQYRQKSSHEEWMIVITTDHGRTAKDGKGHGGQSERERTTWIVTNHRHLNTRFTDDLPAIVDIAPSVLDHLGITMENDIKAEMDGVSFIEDISIKDPSARMDGNNLVVTWEDVGEPGKVELFYANTNYFKVGRKDDYRPLGALVRSEGRYVKTFSEPAGVYKILLKSDRNWTNTWVEVR